MAEVAHSPEGQQLLASEEKERIGDVRPYVFVRGIILTRDLRHTYDIGGAVGAGENVKRRRKHYDSEEIIHGEKTTALNNHEKKKNRNNKQKKKD